MSWMTDWHGIGLKIGLVRYDRGIPYVTFSPSRFPFIMGGEITYPPQLLESIVLCTALLLRYFLILFFFLYWSWLAMKKGSWAVPGPPSSSTFTQADLRWDLGVGRKRGSKATTFPLSFPPSGVIWLLSLCLLFCPNEVTRSMML